MFPQNGIVALACAAFVLAPTLCLAQANSCAGVVPDTRVRLSVPERQWSGVVASAISCSETELVVSHRTDGNVRLPWPSVDRLEVSRPKDLRWPLTAAGAGAGALLGLALPTEDPAECDVDYTDTAYECFDRGTAIFAGISVGVLAGYFGGMFITIDRWQVVPLAGPRTGVLARFSF
jgi:hypothetical protein